MIRIALIASTLIAAPAAAQRFQPGLPSPPPRIDYVESVCTGGIGGIYRQVRVLGSGRVQTFSRGAPVLSAPVSAAEFDGIMRDLDRAKFEQRSIPPQPPRIMDATNCTLTRRKDGRLHRVMLQQEATRLPGAQDLMRILGKVIDLGRRATTPKLRPIGARYPS